MPIEQVNREDFMNAKPNAFIYPIVDIEADAQWIEHIANIECLIQPEDHWTQQSITDLLRQDINQCWLILSLEGNENSKQDKQAVKHQNRETNILNADKKYTLVAYCIFSKVYEVVDILRVGTHPSFQRQGYAEHLLTEIMNVMKSEDVDRIMLEVREDNMVAIKLYQKLGFGLLHTRKNYYISTTKEKTNSYCDALIMAYNCSS